MTIKVCWNGKKLSKPHQLPNKNQGSIVSHADQTATSIKRIGKLEDRDQVFDFHSPLFGLS